MRTIRLSRMGRWIHLTLLSAFLVIFATASCSRRPLGREERLADLDYLLDSLLEAHTFVSLKRRVEGYDWLSHRAEFESLVAEANTDQEFAAAINRILLLLNNCHTRVSDGSVLLAWAQLKDAEGAQPWLRLLEGASLSHSPIFFSEGRCSVILRTSLLNCQYIALAPEAFQLVVHTELPQYSPKTI